MTIYTNRGGPGSGLNLATTRKINAVLVKNFIHRDIEEVHHVNI